jgi:hypothetical protein
VKLTSSQLHVIARSLVSHLVARFSASSPAGYIRAYVRGNSLELNFVDSQTRAVLDQVTLQSKFPVGKSHPKVHAKRFEPIVDDFVDTQ